MNRRELLGGAAKMLGVAAVAGEPAEAFKGIGVFRYPPGGTDLGDGTYKDNLDIARDIVRNMTSGGVVALPSDTDEHGNFLWDFRIEGADPAQVEVRRSDEEAA